MDGTFHLLKNAIVKHRECAYASKGRCELNRTTHRKCTLIKKRFSGTIRVLPDSVKYFTLWKQESDADSHVARAIHAAVWKPDEFVTGSVWIPGSISIALGMWDESLKMKKVYDFWVHKVKHIMTSISFMPSRNFPRSISSKS